VLVPVSCAPWHDGGAAVDSGAVAAPAVVAAAAAVTVARATRVAGLLKYQFTLAPQGDNGFFLRRFALGSVDSDDPWADSIVDVAVVEASVIGCAYLAAAFPRGKPVSTGAMYTLGISLNE